MNITYYYHACVGIKTPDLSILCDPWFTEPIYDGSWYQFPKFENAIDRIPEYDYIYISHVHPDHYDPVFLKAYLNKYSSCKILIANFKNNILHQELVRNGFPHQILDELKISQTHLGFFPNEENTYDIDSALVVKCGDDSVVNMNDNIYNKAQLQAIKEFCPSPTIALLAYSGAGPYPQTYYTDLEVLKNKSEEKKQIIFNRYKKIRDALDPELVLPFAGQYILGGRLWNLNSFRGSADATEVLSFDTKALVLDTCGSIDVKTKIATAQRFTSYQGLENSAFILKDERMDYEKNPTSLTKDEMNRCLLESYENAFANSVCDFDYFFCIKRSDDWFYMNVNRNIHGVGFIDYVETMLPRSEIIIPETYLCGLLTQRYHWNGAQIGSHYTVRRFPDVFNRDVEAFLYFFSVK